MHIFITFIYILARQTNKRRVAQDNRSLARDIVLLSPSELLYIIMSIVISSPKAKDLLSYWSISHHLSIRWMAV